MNPKKPPLELVASGMRSPVSVEASEEFGLSCALLSHSDVVAVICDHMRQGCYTANYRNKTFENWRAYKTPCGYLNKCGFWHLQDNGVSLAPISQLSRIPPKVRSMEF